MNKSIHRYGQPCTRQAALQISQVRGMWHSRLLPRSLSDLAIVAKMFQNEAHVSIIWGKQLALR